MKKAYVCYLRDFYSLNEEDKKKVVWFLVVNVLTFGLCAMFFAMRLLKIQYNGLSSLMFVLVCCLCAASNILTLGIVPIVCTFSKRYGSKYALTEEQANKVLEIL